MSIRQFLKLEYYHQSLLAMILGSKVTSGPLTGMILDDYAGDTSKSPKLLGCYEREIHSHLFAHSIAPQSTIGVLGGAHGYFAVGLALMYPTCKIRVWEKQHRLQKAIKRNARANGVEARVLVEGEFNKTVAGTCGRDLALLLVDIEGAELDLVPQVIDVVPRARLVIEAHPSIRVDHEQLIEQLEGNFRVNIVPVQERIESEVAHLLPSSLRKHWEAFVAEHRAISPKQEPQYWIIADPR